MPNIYPPDIRELDEKYQKESTVQNELVLEKAKLKHYREQLRNEPGNEDLRRRVEFHETEVARIEMLVKMA